MKSKAKPGRKTKQVSVAEPDRSWVFNLIRTQALNETFFNITSEGMRSSYAMADKKSPAHEELKNQIRNLMEAVKPNELFSHPVDVYGQIKQEILENDNLMEEEKAVIVLALRFAFYETQFSKSS